MNEPVRLPDEIKARAREARGSHVTPTKAPSRVVPPASSHEYADDNNGEPIHEYDGILECDNRLPNWWLYLLYGTIGFALVYWFHYQVFKTGDSQTVIYEKEVAAQAAAEAEQLKRLGALTPELLNKMAANPAVVEGAKVTFGQVCGACHGANAGGGIGPNLTDSSWMHGGAPEKIYASIKDGWPQKGMPAWGPSLGEEKVRALAAYVISLRNTNVPGGKEPQGTKEE